MRESKQMDNKRAKIALIGLLGTLGIAPVTRADQVFDCASEVTDRSTKFCQEEVNGHRGGGTVGWYAGCIRGQVSLVGQQLTDVYRELTQRPSAHVEFLRASQRAWLTFQKADCRYSEELMRKEGPSFAHSAAAHCDLQSTALRLCQLKSMREAGQ